MNHEKPKKLTAVERFLRKGAEDCLEDYRKSYLLLENLDLMYETLNNVLVRSIEYKFQRVRQIALRRWGSDKVNKVFEEIRSELFNYPNFTIYQKPK